MDLGLFCIGFKVSSHDPTFGANDYPNSKKLVARINIPTS